MKEQELAIPVQAFPKRRSSRFDQVFPPAGEERELKLRQLTVHLTPLLNLNGALRFPTHESAELLFAGLKSHLEVPLCPQHCDIVASTNCLPDSILEFMREVILLQRHSSTTAVC